MSQLLKPSSWPLLSTFSALGALVAGLVEGIDLDNGHGFPPLTTKGVESLAYTGCTNTEIAAIFMISETHLLECYSGNIACARARRAAALRKAQFDTAKKGNGPLLTWLGRNELGQSLNPTNPGEREPDLDAKSG